MTTNPRRTHTFYLHKQHLENLVDFKSAVGLEIGAMDLPYVAPDEGNCEFADYRSTEELRELARAVPGHYPEFIVPVAYDLKQGYSAITKRFDYIIAAHVVEHIPNLLGWFRSLESLLNPGGIVFLVVPDKRYTFDFYRRETTVSDVVECDRLGLQTPSFYHVFDHHYYSHANLPPFNVWSGERRPPPFKSYLAARQTAEKALSGFEDAHCSVFTPDSFTTLFRDLHDAGLIGFVADSIRETQFGQLDFSVAMKLA